jgi:hypothetical protein
MAMEMVLLDFLGDLIVVFSLQCKVMGMSTLLGDRQL